MDNSYFIFTEQGQNIQIERFHICTWEFRNNSSLIEFGIEISDESLLGKPSLRLELYIPWLQADFQNEDFYSKLKDPQNSRFIFNDSISRTSYLDGNTTNLGVVHQFTERNKLAILPLQINPVYETNRLILDINLNLYHQLPVAEGERKPNIYVRFSVTPQGTLLSTRKSGITKSTIIYDVKINQRRNIPEYLNAEIIRKELCAINSCFCFHIIPNSYDLIFFDAGSLQNVRNLEYSSFKTYINDSRIEKDDLIVVFNKRNALDSYAFFSIYTKERIGADQFALALLVNLVSGILLFIPSYKTGLTAEQKSKALITQLPFFFWLSVGLMICMIIYFIWPRFFQNKPKKN